MLVGYVVRTYEDRFGCFDNPSFEHGRKTKLATASASQRTQPTGYGLLACWQKGNGNERNLAKKKSIRLNV